MITLMVIAIESHIHTQTAAMPYAMSGYKETMQVTQIHILFTILLLASCLFMILMGGWAIVDMLRMWRRQREFIRAIERAIGRRL